MQHSYTGSLFEVGLSRVKKSVSACATVLLFCFALSFQAKALDIFFSNLTNTDVSFSGGGFTFTTNASGYQFSITTVVGGVPDSVGLEGYIAPGGPFTIGTITTTVTPFGNEQTAPVSGTGTLHITDANSVDLTGSIVWQDITTLGTGGFLNLNGVINLTSLAYAGGPGGSSDLAALASAISASDVVSFQLVPAQDLDTLSTTGGVSSYSGDINASPVPEPGTLALSGLAGLLAWSLRRKK